MRKTTTETFCDMCSEPIGNYGAITNTDKCAVILEGVSNSGNAPVPGTDLHDTRRRFFQLSISIRREDGTDVGRVDLCKKCRAYLFNKAAGVVARED